MPRAWTAWFGRGTASLASADGTAVVDQANVINGTLITGDGESTTFAGQIIGAGAGGGITKVGAGELTLTNTGAASTYTGTTIIQQGILGVGANSALGATGALGSGKPDQNVARARFLAPWYRHKREPSFADMLDALRRDLTASTEFFMHPDESRVMQQFTPASEPLMATACDGQDGVARWRNPSLGAMPVI